MYRSIGAGALVALVAQIIALRGFLVSVGVFGASEGGAANDISIYIVAGLFAAGWGVFASILRGLHTNAAVLSYLASWAAIGLFLISLNLWWLLSIGVTIAGLLIGTLIGMLVRKSKRARSEVAATS
ncbi:hypothetical protein AB0O95_12225 [Rhodoglobus sp. NPDC076762]